jgi:hypothetical protein
MGAVLDNNGQKILPLTLVNNQTWTMIKPAPERISAQPRVKAHG